MGMSQNQGYQVCPYKKKNSFLLKMNHFRVNLGGTPTVLETQPI